MQACRLPATQLTSGDGTGMRAAGQLNSKGGGPERPARRMPANQPADLRMAMTPLNGAGRSGKSKRLNSPGRSGMAKTMEWNFHCSLRVAKGHAASC